VQRWVAGRSSPERELRIDGAMATDERVSAGGFWPEHRSFAVATTAGRVLEILPDRTVAELRGRPVDAVTIHWLVPAGEHVLVPASPEIMALVGRDGERSFPLGPPPAGHPNAGSGSMRCISGAVAGGTIIAGTDTPHVLFGSGDAVLPWRASAPIDMTVMGVAPDPGSPSCVAATRDGTLWRVDPDGRREQLGTNLGVYLFKMEASADGELLALACGDRRVRVVDRNGILQLVLPPFGSGICTLGFSRDSRRLFAASFEGEVKIWLLDLEASGAELLERSPYRQAIEHARQRVR
jgi:hypothetical protein